VPPTTKTPNDGLCGIFNESQGCGYNPAAAPGQECTSVSGGPGAAMKDHEIFSVTWSMAEDIAAQPLAAKGPSQSTSQSASQGFEGGAVIDVKDLTLSNGEPVHGDASKPDRIP
jgi:hypothetical protein